MIESIGAGCMIGAWVLGNVLFVMETMKIYQVITLISTPCYLAVLNFARIVVEQ